MKRLAIGLVLLMMTFLIAPVTRTHAPLGPGSNESLATATVVPDPTKSWAC
jgi:hypothetical protein